MKCPSDLTLTPDGVSPEAQASLLLGAKIGCRRQTLTVKTFDTVEQLRRALLEWAELYNERWMIQRHGYLSPAQRRREYYATNEKQAA